MLIHTHVNYEGSDIMKFEVITDLRILNAIGRRYNLQFDKEYKYCIEDNDSWGRCLSRFEYKGNKYKLQYISGCFYPYIVKYN